MDRPPAPTNRRLFPALTGLAAWPVLTGCADAAPAPAPPAQRLDDGRGITAGRAGFTSGTHDLLLVVRRFEVTAGGSTPLTRYVRPLTAIDTQGGGDSTRGLDGLLALIAETNQAGERVRRRAHGLAAAVPRGPARTPA